MSHTPGPWRVGRQGECHSCVVADVPVPGIHGSDDVGFYGGHLIAESINHQNAKLIAAAPDLLDALRVYVEYDEYINGPEGDPRADRLQKARAAIEKATP